MSDMAVRRRIGTQDRNKAVDEVRELYALGFLDDQEREQLSEKALQAKYADDLRNLFREFATVNDRLLPEPRKPFRWPDKNVTGGLAVTALGLCMAFIIPLYASITPKGHGISPLMQLSSAGAVIVGIIIFFLGMSIVFEG